MNISPDKQTRNPRKVSRNEKFSRFLRKRPKQDFLTIRDNHIRQIRSSDSFLMKSFSGEHERSLKGGLDSFSKANSLCKSDQKICSISRVSMIAWGDKGMNMKKLLCHKLKKKRRQQLLIKKTLRSNAILGRSLLRNPLISQISSPSNSSKKVLSKKPQKIDRNVFMRRMPKLIKAKALKLDDDIPLLELEPQEKDLVTIQTESDQTSDLKKKASEGMIRVPLKRNTGEYKRRSIFKLLKQLKI